MCIVTILNTLLLSPDGRLLCDLRNSNLMIATKFKNTILNQKFTFLRRF